MWRRSKPEREKSHRKRLLNGRLSARLFDLLITRPFCTPTGPACTPNTSQCCLTDGTTLQASCYDSSLSAMRDLIWGLFWQGSHLESLWWGANSDLYYSAAAPCHFLFLSLFLDATVAGSIWCNQDDMLNNFLFQYRQPLPLKKKKKTIKKPYWFIKQHFRF